MKRLAIAGSGVLIALCWQYATVNFNYGGNWTSLFCIGSRRAVPPQLADEHLYAFPRSYGFDGQYYHYIAHEPCPGELLPYVEAPGLRYRRILIPLTASLLSLGADDRVDRACLVAGFLFVFAGIVWLGRFAETCGSSAWWGLVFLAAPASITFIDRMTVDHALAALTVAFGLYAARGPSWQLYIVLALAPLAREVGLFLAMAWCAHCVLSKHWRRAVIFATSGIPWLVWTLHISLNYEGGQYSTSLVPLQAWTRWLINPPAYEPGTPLLWFVQFGDRVALLGLLAAVILAGALFLRQRSEPVAIAALLFAVLAVILQRNDVWQTAYNYGRIFSPLFLLVMMGWFPRNRWVALLPLAMVLPRLLMQLAPQALGIGKALIGNPS